MLRRSALCFLMLTYLTASPMRGQSNHHERLYRISENDPNFIFKCISENLTPLVIWIAKHYPSLVASALTQTANGCCYTTYGFAWLLGRTEMLPALQNAMNRVN